MPSRYDFTARRWPSSDLVGIGADLEPETLVDAYRVGVFPMPHDGDLLWWSPQQRGVLLPGGLRVTRSMRRSQRRFTTTADVAFAEVVAGCADPRRDGAWIDADIAAAYRRLHDLGWAHSIEVWDDTGALVGGLYGIAIGALFAGESMFHTATDASKVALMALVQRWPDGLIDTQWQTDHLASLGVVELTRDDYLDRLAKAVDQPRRDVWSRHAETASGAVGGLQCRDA